uniref:C-type lectin domain-containing protein n=1 Tax=Sander lucioperca TaxID=283035 RepID=A0A8C9Z632_SANLU
KGHAGVDVLSCGALINYIKREYLPLLTVISLFFSVSATHHLSKDGIRLSVCFVALFVHRTVSSILSWTKLLPRSLPSWLDSVRLSLFQFQHPGKELDRCRVKVLHCPKIFCKAAGGNLASVHSEEEYSFLKTYINQVSGVIERTWMGGFDSVQEGVWMWSDGSTFDYKSWAPGQPDNTDGVENCLENYNDKWNDNSCPKVFPFLCSKNL